MFVTRWHMKSDGKDTLFFVLDGRPETCPQGAACPAEQGECV